jgi:L-lactate dehydrogenase complex protein LldG
LRRVVNGTILDPLRPWTKTRSFPSMAQKSFRELWRERENDGGISHSKEVEVPIEHVPHSRSAVPVSFHSDKARTAREVILGRIREALRLAAPHPVSAPQQPAQPQKWLPKVGLTVEEQIELFQRNAEGLKAEFRVCADLKEATQFVKTLAANNGWKKIGLHKGELTSSVAKGLDFPKVETDAGYALNELESCDAGLTECEALVAQTGSVLISTVGSGGRALSVLPPHHVVLARRSQMVPDLTVALQKAREKYVDKFPSILSFITGPSRTGDIERILVLGAHGPKKLTILLV